ncbi:hypothetical protein Tco_1164082, partial [Tanacetum coccineum]
CTSVIIRHFYEDASVDVVNGLSLQHGNASEQVFTGTTKSFTLKQNAGGVVPYRQHETGNEPSLVGVKECLWDGVTLEHLFMEMLRDDNDRCDVKLIILRCDVRLDIILIKLTEMT